MAKMKIYDIARSLQGQFPDLKSKDLIELLNANGFQAKSPQSSIEDDAIGFLLMYYKKKAAGEKTEKKKPEKAAPKKEVAQKEVQRKEKAPKKETEQKAKPGTEEKATAKKEEARQPEIEKSQPEGKAEKKAEAPKAGTEKETPVAEKKPEKRENGQKSEKRQGSSERREGRGSDNRNGRGENSRSGRDSERDGGRSDNRNDGRGGNRNGRDGGRDGNRNDGRGGNRMGRDGGRDGNRNDSRGGNWNGRDGRRDGGNRNDSRGGNRNGRDGGRDGARNNAGRGASRNGRDGGNRNDNRRNNGTAMPMDSMKSEVKQSRQQRADRDSRSASKRRGKDRKDDFDEDLTLKQGGKNKKKKDPNRKGAFIKPEPIKKPAEPEDGIKNIVLPEKLTIKELSDIMKVPVATVLKKLLLQGTMVSMNHEITYEEAEEIALEYNCIAEMEEKVDLIAELLKEDEEDEKLMKKRPPVVCVMGHVDHGKTSLLDAIREAHVTDREAGGITQHIGAYVTEINGEKITFLDTPGHEAFTSMRMRGAKSTDIAILVVAADDGVMPQTVEAISHAKAAGVEIIVAVNKIDKPSANVERVKQELVEHELVAEDWGGDTVFVPVSAHTKEGIDQLLEMIILTAEVGELKANPNRKARGVVIEAQLDKGRGPVATVLVQKGTLKVGDNIAVGSAYGKIRAMMDDKGQRVKQALPSTPVEILGLHAVPDAGEIFMATENDKEARNIAETYISQGREKLLDDTKAKLTLDGLFSQIQAGNIKELNLIVKADVQGSVEAVKQSLLKLSNDEVAVRIIHGGVGAINESDVSLASASNAIIIGFNVRPDNTAKETADREKVDVRLYKVIYNAIEDIESAMKGMLDPEYEERVIGHAEVRQTFKASGVGVIAGSYVLDGKIVRDCSVRISREGEQLFEGSLSSLKRFKDDVKEVAAGYECGLVFEGFQEIHVEDQIEAYIMVEVPRT